MIVLNFFDPSPPPPFLCVCALNLFASGVQSGSYNTLQLKLLDHQEAPQSKSDILVGLPPGLNIGQFQALLPSEPIVVAP